MSSHLIFMEGKKITSEANICLHMHGNETFFATLYIYTHPKLKTKTQISGKVRYFNLPSTS